MEVYHQRQEGVVARSESFSLRTDQVNISYSTESVATYDSSMTIQGVANDAYDMLRGLVFDIFEKHGIDTNVQMGDTEIDLAEISQEEAAELVADDGYFGVEQTSDRIVDFAIGIAGGDPGRIDAIKAGVEQGFNEALDAFGGWLPDISYDTYDAVMDKLDAWVEESNGQLAA
jgi:hypothetical protein